MCDYSLHEVKSRPAVVGDKLTTRRFLYGTVGFTPTDQYPNPDGMAVCLLPGTEIAFDEPVAISAYYTKFRQTQYKTAIFRQINLDLPCQHHDCLEFPDGSKNMLAELMERQSATVLQLPAKVSQEPDVKELKSALEDVREALKEIV